MLPPSSSRCHPFRKVRPLRSSANQAVAGSPPARQQATPSQAARLRDPGSAKPLGDEVDGDGRVAVAAHRQGWSRPESRHLCGAWDPEFGAWSTHSRGWRSGSFHREGVWGLHRLHACRQRAPGEPLPALSALPIAPAPWPASGTATMTARGAPRPLRPPRLLITDGARLGGAGIDSEAGGRAGRTLGVLDPDAERPATSSHASKLERRSYGARTIQPLTTAYVRAPGFVMLTQRFSSD